MPGALGRNKPSDWTHVETHPLSALSEIEKPKNVPVVIGTNWYTSFDEPEPSSDGKVYLPAPVNGAIPGTVRGGHCTCLRPADLTDEEAWQVFYNQGQEGACEGFGHARRMTLVHRVTFNAFCLYDDARRVEHTYPTGEGSTNRSTCSALVKYGAHPESGPVCHRGVIHEPAPVKIAAFRWLTTADEVLSVLGYTSGTAIPLLNSWGTEYPHEVLLPPETLELLLQQEGEADVVTDH